jgi:hypothetical protein
MAFWANVAAEHQPAYQRWHNAEHVTERLRIQGFVRGHRYRSVKDETRFLMYYETDGPEVLTSEAYLAALNRPTERTRAALTWFRNPMRNVYALYATWGHRPRTPAPIVVTARFVDCTAWNDYVRPSVSLGIPPALCGYGVRRLREYRLDPAGSAMRTSEASLHGARSGLTGGLLLLESDDLQLLDSSMAWASLDAAMRNWAEKEGLAGVEEVEVSSLEFALESERHQKKDTTE